MKIAAKEGRKCCSLQEIGRPAESVLWIRHAPLPQVSWRTSEQLRATPSNSEQLRATPSNSKQLRATPSNSEQLRATPSNSEQLRATPSNSEQLRATISRSALPPAPLPQPVSTFSGRPFPRSSPRGRHRNTGTPRSDTRLPARRRIANTAVPACSPFPSIAASALARCTTVQHVPPVHRDTTTSEPVPRAGRPCVSAGSVRTAPEHRRPASLHRSSRTSMSAGSGAGSAAEPAGHPCRPPCVAPARHQRRTGVSIFWGRGCSARGATVFYPSGFSCSLFFFFAIKEKSVPARTE
jgi:hypothetical protein